MKKMLIFLTDSLFLNILEEKIYSFIFEKMVNTVNHSNSIDAGKLQALQQSWSVLTDQQLYSELWNYYQRGDLDMAQALQEYIDLKKQPTQVQSGYKNFWAKYQQVEHKVAEIDKKYDDEITAKTNITDEERNAIEVRRNQEKASAFQDFFKNDMQAYIKEVGSDLTGLQEGKDREIADLKNQLTGIVTQWPKLSEYLSLKRRKLVSIQAKIQKLKADAAHYPKNVLIYLMGVTTTIFGTRQKLKRGWISALWKWKSDDIKAGLRNFEENIQINAHDSQWTIGLKKLLKEQMTEAKKAYIDQQKQNVGLAA